jgi:hypothetical protein
MVGMNGDRVVLAGGNQNDQVKYASFKLSNITTYCVPDGYHVPQKDYNLPNITLREANATSASTRE